MRFYYKVSNMFKKLKGEINMKKFLSALMAIVLAISTALAASAAFDRSVKIGDFKLSSDINKVIVKSSGLQAYNLTKATWQSSIEFSGMVWVK